MITSSNDLAWTIANDIVEEYGDAATLTDNNGNPKIVIRQEDDRSPAVVLFRHDGGFSLRIGGAFSFGLSTDDVSGHIHCGISELYESAIEEDFIALKKFLTVVLRHYEDNQKARTEFVEQVVSRARKQAQLVCSIELLVSDIEEALFSATGTKPTVEKVKEVQGNLVDLEEWLRAQGRARIMAVTKRTLGIK